MLKVRRSTILAGGAGLLLVLLLILLVFRFAPSRRTEPLSRAVDTLPVQIADSEFWRIVSDFSEAGGYFRSDNFLSNEAGYQTVIPDLKKTVQPGGAYIGVGPEQNFTYIVALQPNIAFIVDIRRLNMLEHLLYKAVIELSADRADFLSRLFSRKRPAGLDSSTAVEALFGAYRAVEPNHTLFDGNLREVMNHLTRTHGFRLSSDDEKNIQYAYQAFFDSGPDLSYVFKDSFGGAGGMPTYADLMTERDGRGHNWSFLAAEDPFRTLQKFEKDNRIIPLVGDFAGDKAIRSIGRYLKEHHALLSAFYTSNVEMYLFQQGDDWKHFYGNVGTLPIDSASTFIRFVLNRGGFSFATRGFGRRSQMWSSVDDVMQAFDSNRIARYSDVIDLSK